MKFNTSGDASSEQPFYVVLDHVDVTSVTRDAVVVDRGEYTVEHCNGPYTVIRFSVPQLDLFDRAHTIRVQGKKRKK